MNNITFNLGKGGSGRPLTGEDYISGLLLYNANLPSGFSTSNRIKAFYGLADAIAAGIALDYTDETKATGSYLVTAAGATGDTLTVKVNEPFSNVVTLGTYTKAATDTTVNLVATGIAAAINLGTNVHGYTATVATATVTITARKGLGIFLNSSTPLSFVLGSGTTIAGTITQFTGGVASYRAVWYYHIKEFFRMQPQGILYVGIYTVPGSYTFTEIATMQNFANGKIRQFGVYKDSAAFATADIQAIHAQCATLVGQHKECIALYGADITATPDVSTLTDLSTLNSNYCSAVIGQDGAALGATLYAAYGKSITNLGAILGAVAKAKVSQSIAWVAQFNISDGTENDSLAFANGQLFSSATITQSYQDAIDAKQYIFLRKFVGVSGSYFNENYTSIVSTSDYRYIADNRTIQKATRGVYAAVIPALNSPITLNADGTLSDQAIAYFNGLASSPLNQMVRDSELSGFSVSISSVQNILSTGILTININLVQIATGRNISINIGYRVSV